MLLFISGFEAMILALLPGIAVLVLAFYKLGKPKDKECLERAKEYQEGTFSKEDRLKELEKGQ